MENIFLHYSFVITTAKTVQTFYTKKSKKIRARIFLMLPQNTYYEENDVVEEEEEGAEMKTKNKRKRAKKT